MLIVGSVPELLGSVLEFFFWVLTEEGFFCSNSLSLDAVSLRDTVDFFFCFLALVGFFCCFLAAVTQEHTLIMYTSISYEGQPYLLQGASSW